MFWIFNTLPEAEAANDSISAMLPPDRLMDGTEAKQQVTLRWSDIMPLDDGRFAIAAFPGADTPGGAVVADVLPVTGDSGPSAPTQ